MKIDTTIFQPSHGSWEKFAKKGVLRSVLDQGDITGKKNRYIDRLDKIAFHSTVRLNKDMVVLDFGCGSGRMTKYFSNRVERVIGMEITNGMLNLARKESNGVNINYGMIDGIHIPLKDSSIDLITTFYVLQYIAWDKKIFSEILQEFKRVLKANGKIFFLEQMSFCKEKSNSLRKSVTKQDYLETLYKFFNLKKSFAVRLGGVPVFMQRIVFKKHFPEILYIPLTWLEIVKVKGIKENKLSSYPYVDCLFYGDIK